jgi:hypothetical protein
MPRLENKKNNFPLILCASFLLVSFAALFFIPYLREIFNDREVPSFTEEIKLYFLIISTLQIILYYFLLKLFKNNSGINFKVLLLLALLAAAIFFILPPQGAVDINNNIFFTKIFSDYGVNPYLHPIKEFPNDVLFPETNRWWKGVTPYGPAWSLLSLVPYKLSGPLLAQKIFSFRAFNLLFWGITGYLIFLILKKTKPNLAPLATIAYLFNPLILFEAVNNAHNDLIFIFFILLAIYFYLNNKKSLVIPFLTISVLIKYVSLLIIPFFLWSLWRDKQTRKKHLLIGIFLSLIVTLLILWPFSFDWRAMLLSLKNQTTILHNPYYLSLGPIVLFTILSYLGQSFEITKFLSFGLSTSGYVFLLINFLKKEAPIAATFWTLALLLLTATFWLQPWYFLWLIPLIILKMEKPLFSFLLFSLSLAGLWTYGIYPLPLGTILMVLIGILFILKITGQKIEISFKEETGP